MLPKTDRHHDITTAKLPHRQLNERLSIIDHYITHNENMYVLRDKSIGANSRDEIAKPGEKLSCPADFRPRHTVFFISAVPCTWSIVFYRATLCR